ncbi:Uncharacterized protein M6B38_215975 [Iris pallida]|uniref:SAP domain-containing protein n=1 Tax=Iris pallida TaxID=29817 RepID=A0AAX6E141_IRIPA|nr:Uncharacterized protein M6B38_215975 [Iris pallida]
MVAHRSSSRSRPQSRPASSPPTDRTVAGRASGLLANLPSRGLLSSTVLSSNLGGIRVYVCDHDTSPPEEQVIKTNTTNILIRALQTNKQKSDAKDAASKHVKESNKGKRSAGRSLESRTSAKRANTAGASSSTRVGGSSSGFSEETLQGMTVERLRGLLKERGLSNKGKKDELISRLRDEEN